MYPFLIALLIIAATVENLWPSIIGFMKTPPGMVFLGTVHHPADYFYYLSQFAQHASFVFAENLYTSEPVAPSLVGWLNVVSGRLFAAFGVGQIFAYQISLVILTIGALVAAYILTKSVLKTPRATLLGFFFFVLFHAFPVMREGVSSYADYWNNYAVPRVRLGGVPHQLAITVLSCIIPLVFFHLAVEKNTRKYLFVGMLASVFLGSLQPVLWLLILASIGLTVTARRVLFKIPVTRRMLLSLLSVGGAGMIPVTYLAFLFRNLPYRQLAAWEATQMTVFTAEHFILATGPLFLIAVLSLTLLGKRLTVPLLFMMLFTGTSFLLFLLPVGGIVGISHVRFMSTLGILGTAIIAASGLDHLLAAKVVWLRVVTYAVIVGISVLLLPNHIKTLMLTAQFAPNNLYQYLPQREYALLSGLTAQSTPRDTFLLPSPYNTIFPAISGRRSYNGHPLITIHAAAKDREVEAFFAEYADLADMHKFVTNRGITWIVSTPNPKLAEAGWVREISRSDSLTAYQVVK